MDVLHEVDGDLQLLGLLVELVGAHVLDLPDLGVHHPHVVDGLDDVPGSGLALGPDHGRSLGDPSEGLAEVPRTADEGDLELGLVDVVDIIGRGEDLALIDVIDLEGLEDLSLDEMPDTALGHDGDGDGVLDALDHLGVAHTGDSSRCADVRGDPLEGHDGRGSRFLCDPSLFGRGDIHDDAALEHLSEFLVQFVPALCHVIDSVVENDPVYISKRANV